MVCPIKDEINLIPVTLPSFYNVNPSEVILCFDDPPDKKAYTLARHIAQKYDIPTKFIFVKRDPEWRFHQACVRRKGFLEAKYDRILTCDIDLIINKNVLKAVELVGKNGIGLVSLSKIRYPKKLTDYWREAIMLFLRNVIHGILDKIVATTTFTGLYAVFRPYWLETEPLEQVKKLVNPKQVNKESYRVLEPESPIMGEDTFLRDCMQKKYKCIYLRDIGAIDLGTPLEDNPTVQYTIGRYFALQGRPLLVSLGRAIVRAQPHYLMGYLRWRKLKCRL